VSGIIYKSVPRSKHSVSVIQANQLMLYREIIAVCSQTRTKHINTAMWAERRIAECQTGGTKTIPIL
jgi:hypothetical protein